MIPLFKVFMNEEVDKSLLEVIHSGWIGQGSKVELFEGLLSRRMKNNNCLSLSAGTHGLHLALRLAGVDTNSEVITTPLTCTATNWPILYQGAKIVWADVKSDDLNIDPMDVERKITKDTRAIICVHWGGYPCDMAELGTIAVNHNLILIEDAAHAFGANYRGGPIGSCDYSDFTVFSFQAIKHLTTGDGGALFSKEISLGLEDHRRARLLRWYGIDREGPKKDMRCEEEILEWGYKYHMNDICAVIGISNLKWVDFNLNIQQDNVDYYKKELNDFSGITLIQNSPDRTSANWLFTFLVKKKEDFKKFMGEKGIHVSSVHERNDKHPCVGDFKIDLPNLNEVVEEMVCIPCGWWVTEDNREYIVDCIGEGW